MFVVHSSMPVYRENFIRLLYAIIIAQFAVIALLLGGLSNEYLRNAYYQTWVNENAPFLSVLLHGELDALFIGVAMGATVLFIQRAVARAKTQPESGPTFQPSASGTVPIPASQGQTIQDDPTPDPATPPPGKSPQPETRSDLRERPDKDNS